MGLAGKEGRSHELSGASSSVAIARAMVNPGPSALHDELIEPGTLDVGQIMVCSTATTSAGDHGRHGDSRRRDRRPDA